MSDSRRKSALSTRAGSRPRQESPYRILIVTEGRVTEKDYFEALIKRLRITSEVDVQANGGNAPKSVVKVARDTIRSGKNYSTIFCVIDRDNHNDYDDALSEIDKINSYSAVEVMPIPSFPCFEYWLHLHEKYSTKPYSAYGSPASEMIKDLKNIETFEHYNKSISNSLFNVLYENCGFAIKNAKKSLEYAYNNTEASMYHEDPSTRIHIVVERLKEIFEDRVP